MDRKRAESLRKIIRCGGLCLELGPEIRTDLLFLQMLIRLKKMGLDLDGGGVWICKITCPDKTKEKIRKGAKAKKDLLILEEENAPDQVVERWLRQDKHIRQSLLFLAAGTEALSFLIDLNTKTFEIVKEKEAFEVTARAWEKAKSGQKLTS